MTTEHPGMDQKAEAKQITNAYSSCHCQLQFLRYILYVLPHVQATDPERLVDAKQLVSHVSLQELIYPLVPVLSSDVVYLYSGHDYM